MNYNIDVSVLLKRIIKREFRIGKWISYLTSALKPFTDINDTFVATSSDINYRMQFNCQTIYLEHYLNDQYDDVLRAIYIENTGNTNQVYIFNEEEGQLPPYIFNEDEPEYATEKVYIFNEDEAMTSEDFIVWVPSYVTYDEVVMRAQIDQYRLAGKIYSIQTY